MKTNLWHRLSKKRQEQILENNGPEKLTWGDFQKKYRQPSWCAYPDALAGQWGCWSLVGFPGKIKRSEDCQTCECCIVKKSVGDSFNAEK